MVFEPTAPSKCSMPVATAPSVSKRMYGIDALSQNVASLSLAKTTSAQAAAWRSEDPSPTNTVRALVGLRAAIAAGLQVAQPCAQVSTGWGNAACQRAPFGRSVLDTMCEPVRSE